MEQARGNAREADATLAEGAPVPAISSNCLPEGFISQAALDAEDKKVRLAAALADTAHAAVTQAGAHLDEFTVRAPAGRAHGVPAGRSRGSRYGRQAGADFCPPGPGRGAAGRGRSAIWHGWPSGSRWWAPDAFPDRQFGCASSGLHRRWTVTVEPSKYGWPAHLAGRADPQHDRVDEIVVAQKPSALTLPAAAIWEAQGREYVWRVENGRVMPVAVIVSPAASWGGGAQGPEGR